MNDTRHLNFLRVAAQSVVQAFKANKRRRPKTNAKLLTKRAQLLSELKASGNRGIIQLKNGFIFYKPEEDRMYLARNGAVERLTNNQVAALLRPLTESDFSLVMNH
jgi:hypothetical protein